MRWRGGRRSGNIEDRRGGGFGGGFRSPFGGGGGGMRFPGGFPIPTGRGGFGGIGMVVVILIVLFLAFNQGGFLDDGTDQSGVSTTDQSGGSTTDQAGYSETPGEGELRDFVAVVLGDTEDTWSALFSEMNRSYDYPTLVLFTGAVESACGYAQSVVGPFYCPGDQRIYLDLGFFAELARRFAAPGDFAAAYVIAHEVGHHVQTLLGITGKVDSLRARSTETQANALSVRVELQADCFAGVWAYHANAARQILETGDIEEALTAASAIGDDRLQRETQGYVVPDSFTHGSSEQRVSWFRTGFAEGSISDCDTFNAGTL